MGHVKWVDMGAERWVELMDTYNLLLQTLISFGQRLTSLEERVAEVHALLLDKKTEKEWYSTDEVAKILGKADFTVREKWCNQGRIEAVKDEGTGKWRIPGHELKRLRNGGGLRPAKD
jgi:excisionase family DNA binding protein